MTNDPQLLDQHSAAETGLRCVHCDHNLTGLTKNRCPECGKSFTQDGSNRSSRTAQLYAAIGHAIVCLLVVGISVICVPVAIRNKSGTFNLVPNAAGVLVTAVVFQLPLMLLCTLAGISKHEKNRYRRVISNFSRAAALATIINIAVALLVLGRDR